MTGHAAHPSPILAPIRGGIPLPRRATDWNQT